MKLQQQKLFYIFRLAALIFLLTGLLFSSLLLNIEQIQSDIAFRINLLLSGVLPLLTGTYLIFMVFCPDSWSKYLSGKAVLMATSGCGFIFFHATVSFTEIFLATPAVMSGIVGELGKLAGVGLLTVAFGLWIVEQRDKERMLQDSRNRYRGLVESQQDMIVVADSENRLRFANDAYCRAFGGKRRKLEGGTFEPDVHEDDVENTRENSHKLKNPPYRVSFEQRLLTEKGWRWIEWAKSAVLDENGKITEFQGIGRDITEQKLARQDLHKAKERLQAVISNSPLLICECDLQGRYALVNPAISGWNINVEKKLSHGLPPVEASEEQLGQVFLNLFNNAEYFMRRRGKSGTLTVCTSQVENNAEIKILDSGPGVPENALDKLFSPFFTTKPEGEGTGLGLSVSYGIVKEHGGRLDAKNRKEGGAAFTILLPLTN